jgi:hypothetical protein
MSKGGKEMIDDKKLAFLTEAKDWFTRFPLAITYINKNESFIAIHGQHAKMIDVYELGEKIGTFEGISEGR